jgi:hypothetical protein
MAEVPRRSDRRSATSNADSPTPADRDGNPGSDDVARRAYELYERRGGEHGRDWDDWFQAEQEIRERGPKSPSSP